MNPCPCGYRGSTRGDCRCADHQVQRYLGKLSGPLLDRIDMHVEVPGLPPGVLLSGEREEDSATVRQRVQGVRERQIMRSPGITNRRQTSIKNCAMTPEASALLERLAEKYNLSARVCHRMIRVARTIADLAHSDMLIDAHLGEAFAYRCFHRFVRSQGEN